MSKHMYNVCMCVCVFDHFYLFVHKYIFTFRLPLQSSNIPKGKNIKGAIEWKTVFTLA